MRLRDTVMKVVRAFEELGVGVGKQTPRALPKTPFSARIQCSRIMGKDL